MPAQTYDLRANTQLTHHSLRIGTAGIRPRDYTDDSGATRHGPTAGLWIYYREDPAQDRFVRVHPGQALDVAGYTIEVLDIQVGEPGVVKLRVTEPQPAAESSPG
jgi:hypothetical protein